MTERKNIRLDKQAIHDAEIIMEHFNLEGTSAAIRYALRSVARQVEAVSGKVADKGTDVAKAGEASTTENNDTAP